MSADLERLSYEWSKLYPAASEALKAAAQKARQENAPLYFQDQVGKRIIPVPTFQSPAQVHEFIVEEQRQFFDDESLISTEPNQQFLDLGKRLQDKGFTSFEPIFFPRLKIENGVKHTQSWHREMNSWVYGMIAEGIIPADAAELHKGWAWIDTTARESFLKSADSPVNGVEKAIASLRTNGLLEVPDPRLKVPDHSRFWISNDDATTILFPDLAQKIGLDKDQVTALSIAEFNYAGNLRYGHFGAANTWEWMNTKDISSSRNLISGNKDLGGISSVMIESSSKKTRSVSVRPIIKL